MKIELNKTYMTEDRYTVRIFAEAPHTFQFCAYGQDIPESKKIYAGQYLDSSAISGWEEDGYPVNGMDMELISEILEIKPNE